jgi:hypothetical protein
VDGVGIALFVCQACRSGANIDVGFFLVGGNLGSGQCRARVCAAKDHVHVLSIEPLTRLARRDISFIQVIGIDELDLLAIHFATKILDCHFHGFDATCAISVRVRTTDIGDEADLHDIV